MTATWIRGLVVAIAAFVLASVVALGLRWFDAAATVVSPDNVAETYRQAYSQYEALEATAGNVCAARAAVAAESDPAVRAQRVSQQAAYEQNYRRIAADYDAAYDDAFRARHVGPTDLPADAPELDAALATQDCAKDNER